MFDWVLNALLEPLIITATPYVYNSLFNVTLGAPPQLQTRRVPRVQSKAWQFCEPFLVNCKSKSLQKNAKQLFMTIKYFFRVDQARKEITQITFVFHRIAKDLVRTHTSLVT